MESKAEGGRDGNGKSHEYFMPGVFFPRSFLKKARGPGYPGKSDRTPFPGRARDTCFVTPCRIVPPAERSAYYYETAKLVNLSSSST